MAVAAPPVSTRSPHPSTKMPSRITLRTLAPSMITMPGRGRPIASSIRFTATKRSWPGRPQANWRATAAAIAATSGSCPMARKNGPAKSERSPARSPSRSGVDDRRPAAHRRRRPGSPRPMAWAARTTAACSAPMQTSRTTIIGETPRPRPASCSPPTCPAMKVSTVKRMISPAREMMIGQASVTVRRMCQENGLPSATGESEMGACTGTGLRRKGKLGRTSGAEAGPYPMPMFWAMRGQHEREYPSPQGKVVEHSETGRGCI